MTAKTKRLEFRTTAETRLLMDEAVTACNLTLSEFAEQTLQREARRVLADRRTFALTDEQHAAWEKLNEEPAQTLPGLLKLMIRPSPFTDE